MLAGVARVGDAEAELEVEALEQTIAEEMAFDHAELANRLVAHDELHGGADIA